MAVHALLQAVRPGTPIHWRNDFDWPGVRMTATALDRYPAARPWRMAAADYLSGVPGGLPLTGSPAGTPWDPALATVMRETGRAVMEERLLDVLRQDLDLG